MKGYKATKNMKCRDFLYEVGKIYSINNLEICSTGFHFCQSMGDVLEYYNYDDNFVLLEVEALGETITEDDKTVTDCLKIIRIIPKEEYTFEIPIPKPKIDYNIYEYDDRNNMIFMTFPDGDKWSLEYDDRNNRISETSPRGRKWSYEYDDRGNKISETHPSGYKISYEYDDRNNKISETYPNGNKYSYEYDDWGNRISETVNNKERYRITIN